MFVYFVMRSQRLHCNKCEGWHSQFEHYRVHVHGVYLSKDTAKKIAAQRSKKNGKHFVQGFKVKDADEVIGKLPAGFILMPLGLQVVDPCENCKQPCGNIACPKRLR